MRSIGRPLFRKERIITSAREIRRAFAREGLLQRWLGGTIFSGASDEWSIANDKRRFGLARSGQYRVVIDRRMAVVEPIPPAELLETLESLRLRDCFIVDHVTSRSRLLAPFALTSKELRSSPAFASTLVRMLQSTGASVSIEDRRLYAPNACELDAEVGKRLLDRRHEWTRAVAENHRGLIAYSTDDERLSMIRDLARLLPEAEVLALCVSLSDVQKVHDALKEARRTIRRIQPEGVESNLYKVHVGFAGGFADYLDTTPRPDLVIVPRCELLLQELGQFAFLANCGFQGRVYGLYERGSLDHPADLQQLRFYVGDVIYRDGIAASGWLVGHPLGKRFRRAPTTDIASKRALLTDARLMQAVLDLALRLKAGETISGRRLREEAGAEFALEPTTSRRRVAIVTETAELAELLLRTCSSACLSRTSPEQPTTSDDTIPVLSLREVEGRDFPFDVGVGIGVDPRHEPLRQTLAKSSVARFVKPDPDEPFAFFMI